MGRPPKAKENVMPRTGPNGRRYANYIAQDTANLTAARGWADLGLLRFELSPAERAGRVQAYACQIEEHGEIVAWLPPPRRQQKRSDGPARFGQQRRWFELGRLDGSCWSPAFVSGG
jgi:hypothetical protein